MLTCFILLELQSFYFLKSCELDSKQTSEIADMLGMKSQHKLKPHTGTVIKQIQCHFDEKH